ncbi:MAG: hypothetical protein ACFCUE_11120 [Candidatus Bathyarchaeia archaeon]
MFKYKSFEEIAAASLKPQFPNNIILHNSDGSSCIIGFNPKEASGIQINLIRKVELITGKTM